MDETTMLVIGIAITAILVLRRKANGDHPFGPQTGLDPVWPYDARQGESREQMLARWERER